MSEGGDSVRGGSEGGDLVREGSEGESVTGGIMVGRESASEEDLEGNGSDKPEYII